VKCLNTAENYIHKIHFRLLLLLLLLSSLLLLLLLYVVFADSEIGTRAAQSTCLQICTELNNKIIRKVSLMSRFL
jgi:hypothetical protein